MMKFAAILLFTAGWFAAQTAMAEPPSPPVFSNPAGTYITSIDLELTGEDGVTIYYTTNGRTPTRSSLEYIEGEPIQISGSMMIRARAYRDDGSYSEPVTRIYSQLAQGVREFDSNLPLVIVHQFDDVMHPYGAYRSTVYFSVIEPGDDGRARLLSDNLHLHSRSRSNYRGTSSLGFPKKQFGVRLIDEHGENRNEPVLGMPPENNWIMHAPWDDRTLIRNAIAYQLGRDTGRYAPRTRFVELFLHEGDGPVTSDHYHGVYMLVERIKWDDNRVDIAKLTRDDNTEPEISGGYIINYEHGREYHFSSSGRGTRFALVRPQYYDITPQQQSWLSNYIGDLESALFGPDFRDPDEGYAAWLEPESFIDHHLITEALKEMDGFRLSTFMYKDRGGRMIMGPLWDYNLSMGNHNPDEGWGGDSPIGWYYPNLSQGQYLNGWYTRLFQDPVFRDRYHERWWELRQGPLSTGHIINMINDYVGKLDEAQVRNFQRWPILGEDVWHYSRAGFETWEEEISQLISWIESRMNWIDSQIPLPEVLPESHLRYYWHIDENLSNNTPFTSLNASYSLLEQACIRFHSALEGYPFDEEHPDWRRASMERRNRPTDLNYHSTGNEGRPYNRESGRSLQIRQPFHGDGGENTLIFDLPTTGVGDVVFRFAAVDEGAAETLLIDYTVRPDEPEWITTGLPELEYPLDFEYQLYELDFSDIPEVDDNPDFKIRIRFNGGDMSADHGGRVTFGNFSLEAASHDTTENNDAEDDYAYDFRLLQNYPNPFNPVTNISYSLSGTTHVTLTVYDVTGREVATLVDRRQEAGEYRQVFDGTGLASGVYIYELRTEGRRISRMMTFIK